MVKQELSPAVVKQVHRLLGSRSKYVDVKTQQY